MSLCVWQMTLAGACCIMLLERDITESLLVVWCPVLLLLPQAMTRPFEPGADRLEKLPHKDSEVSGCPVIEGANAVLDCKVVSATRPWPVVLFGLLLSVCMLKACIAKEE
jgi:flavin reductase (DIM6/NTAB) family NADH-FMN oxidoreductase RutF